MNGVDVARTALGATLVLRPEVATALTRTPATTDTTAVVRLLGGRYLAQGLLGVVAPRSFRKLGMTVEALHAASMVPLGLDHPEHARLAAAGGAVATGLVLWEALR